MSKRPQPKKLNYERLKGQMAGQALQDMWNSIEETPDEEVNIEEKKNKSQKNKIIKLKTE